MGEVARVRLNQDFGSVAKVLKEVVGFLVMSEIKKVVDPDVE